MTVEEYTARNKEIQASISQLQAQATALRSQASRADTSAQEWLNNISSCKGKVGNKKTECEQDGQWKQQKSASAKATANSLREQATTIEAKQIPDLRKEFDNNVKMIAQAQASSAETSKILAQSGKTQESVTIESKANAEAIKQTAEITAKAQAEAINKNAEAEADGKKKRNLIFMVVGGVLALIVVVILIKKFKKK
ncbi:MAG: hypothetical protein E6Q36_09335 [Chryseobacterium sp.]|nr:MAG: hypothetical protein E6Q36_09335 [Chryseobacterium sp.]